MSPVTMTSRFTRTSVSRCSQYTCTLCVALRMTSWLLRTWSRRHSMLPVFSPNKHDYMHHWCLKLRIHCIPVYSHISFVLNYKLFHFRLDGLCLNCGSIRLMELWSNDSMWHGWHYCLDTSKNTAYSTAMDDICRFRMCINELSVNTYMNYTDILIMYRSNWIWARQNKRV